VAAADVFQALAQNRPYRGPLPPLEILSILQELAHKGKLDPDIVQKIEENLDDCHRVALNT
jgi:HD-GYP domain-containing protein (c-di-GMP phosphodiesterase class II)